MNGHHRFQLLAGVAALLLAASPAPAHAEVAAVPSVTQSILPICMIASPDGAFASTVVVRDLASNPIANSTVTLDFSSCSLYNPCLLPCIGCNSLPAAHQIRKLTDASGAASFDLRIGGVCPNELVTISADGIILGTAKYSSLDQNGDLSVTGADIALVQNAQISGDLSADFDCSGTVTAADLTILNAHLGVTCNGVVSSAKHSWGHLKGAYR